jgi:hypothetical protein
MLANPSTGGSSLEEDSLEELDEEEEEPLELEVVVPELECSLLLDSSLVDESIDVTIGPPGTCPVHPASNINKAILKNKLTFFIYYYSKLLKYIFNNNKNSRD